MIIWKAALQAVFFYACSLSRPIDLLFLKYRKSYIQQKRPAYDARRFE